MESGHATRRNVKMTTSVRAVKPTKITLKNVKERARATELVEAERSEFHNVPVQLATSRIKT